MQHNDLPTIPRTPTGIFDRLKARMPSPDPTAVAADVQDLLARNSWSGSTRVPRVPGSEFVMDGEGGTTRIWCKATGCVVYVNGSRLDVEASPARLLGLTNDQQHLVSVGDLKSAFQQMTEGLFPRATAAAVAPWRTVSAELAKNFIGELALLARSLREARHSEIRSGAIEFEEERADSNRKVVSEPTGIMWAGVRKKVVLYDVRKKRGRGKLRRHLKGKAFSQGESLLRFEVTFKSPTKLAQLADVLAPSADGLPFAVPGGDSEPRVELLAIDYHALHRLLAGEVCKLGAARVPAGLPGRKGASLIALHALAQDPEKYVPLLDIAFEDVAYRRRLLRDAQALRERRDGVDLVRLVWSRPQIAPEVRQGIRRQRRELGIDDGRCPRAMVWG